MTFKKGENRDFFQQGRYRKVSLIQKFCDEKS